jgi:ClpX C4-type zinc finger
VRLGVLNNLPNERKCTWCDKHLGVADGILAAGDVYVCDDCLNNVSDAELLRDPSLVRIMLDRSTNKQHCERIYQLLLKHPEKFAWSRALLPQATNERVENLTVCWLQLNVANPDLHSVGNFADSNSPNVLRALFKWIQEGGQDSQYMPPLLADFIKASTKFDTASNPRVLEFVRCWLKSNLEDERAGLVYSALISISDSTNDNRNAMQWYLTHKENRFAWKVIASWLGLSHRYSSEQRYAFDAAKELLKLKEWRAEHPGLVSSLLGVKSDEESVGWAKEAYESTGMLWILIQLLKHAPDQSLIAKAEESFKQWIETESEEAMLYALFKADPGNEFAHRQAMSFIERHPGYEFCVCSFCGEAHDDVAAMIREKDAYICSGCALSFRESPQALYNGGPANCSFCHELQQELVVGYKHKICNECLKLADEIIREEEVGQKFMAAALATGSSDLLPNSIFSDETRECSFCAELKTNCCSLFPGSQSEVCDACYDKYSERTEASMLMPCAMCDSEDAGIVSAGFKFCPSCIKTLSQQVEKDRIAVTSTLAQSRCSMCYLNAPAVYAGEVRLCTVCVGRIQAVLDEPKPEPKVGQNLLCRIARAEPGGYAVYVGVGTQGFLATRAKLKRGLKLSVQFACWYRGRMMLKPRPSFN